MEVLRPFLKKQIEAHRSEVSARGGTGGAGYRTPPSDAQVSRKSLGLRDWLVIPPLAPILGFLEGFLPGLKFSKPQN